MSQSDTNRLSNIVYISLPDNMERTIGDFEIDPSILIPVEVIPGEEEWSIQNLSWEMIIAAMLKVLVHDPDNENNSYYRDFVFAAKPGIAEELSKTGVEKARERDFETAEEIFLALQALTPEETTSAVNLALVYEQRADAYDAGNRASPADSYREKAHEMYTRIFHDHPDDANAHFNAGHFFLKIRNYDRAKTHLEAFLSLSKDKKKKGIVERVLKELKRKESTEKLFNEAYDFIRLGRESDGIAKIHAFLDEQPEVWNAWFLLGWAQRRLGNYKEGKEAFERALELGPEQTDTLNELSICLMELAEYERCRSTLERALRIEPENVKIISNLGILALKQEKPEEAKGFFKSVLEIEPEDPIARSYLDSLESE